MATNVTNQAQNTAAETTPKLMITPSPHVKDSITTQDIMFTVLVGLFPALLAAVWYFGMRALIVTLVSVIACIAFEWLFNMVVKKDQTVKDLSAMVTGVILAFNLPSTIPLWMVVVGAFIAIVVVKCLFGGIGTNFANPAATARIFMLVSFATPMTTWTAPRGVDASATATPLSLIASGETDKLPSLMQMFIGQRGGSMGETCAIAIILGGAFLLYKGIISWHIPASMLASVFVFALLFGENPLYAILSGGVMIGAFFMATDYSTSPVTDTGKIVFGIGIGFLTMVIRSFCSYPEGCSFAILLMNILVPHIDSLTMTKPFGAISVQKKG